MEDCAAPPFQPCAPTTMSAVKGARSRSTPTLTCPHCAVAHQRLLGEDARVVFRHLALRRATGGRCRSPMPPKRLRRRAGSGGAWTRRTQTWAGSRIRSVGAGRGVGLDVARFDADRRSDAIAARVQRDVKDALRAGATGTPTLFDL